MANVTITACANSTPPANTVVATCALSDSSNAQLVMLSDSARNIHGVSGSPLFASVGNALSASISGGSVALLAGVNSIGDVANILNRISASISNSPSVVVSSGSVVVTNGLSASISNSLTVGNALSASISGGSVALLAGANSIGDVANILNRISASISNSPSVVISSGSVVVTNQISASVSNSLTVGNALSASISGGSIALLAGANSIGDVANILNRISASISNSPSVIVSSGSVVVTNALSASVSGGSVALLAGANVVGSASVIQSTPTGIGNAWPVKITDGTDTVGVNAASQMLVAVSAASVNIVDTAGNQYGISAASPLYVSGGAGGTSSTDKATFAEGSTAFTPTGGVFLETTVGLTASQSGLARMTAQRAIHVNLRDANGSQIGAGAASPLYISVSNSPSVVVSSGSVVVTNALSASISNTLTVGNILSASIGSGSIALLAGANVIGSASVIQSTPTGIANAWPFKLTDGTDTAIVTAASLLAVDASGTTASRIISSGSVVVTNALSASISGGSLAMLTGANVIGSASAIQGTAACPAAAWSVRISDLTDTATVTAASALHVNLRSVGGSELGVTGSPLIIDQDNGTVFVSGSVITLNSKNVSASTSGCIIIVSGCAGKLIRVLAATYTTSGCQNIGWLSGSSASSLLQSPMPFATFGGMDSNRMPDGYLWQTGSGSALVMTTTQASVVAGNLNFIYVPG